jgi:hypothetical protein
MSNEARHRDIAALAARVVIRVKQQPRVTKAIASRLLVKPDACDQLVTARVRHLVASDMFKD